MNATDRLFCKTTAEIGAISERWREVCRPALAALMLILWLTTFALTASPQLHHLLHHDAQSLNHHCLITQIKQHQLLVDFAKALAPTQLLADLGAVGWAEFQFLSDCDYRLSPSRAPPSVISSITVVG
jgi:hypothetical protein